MEFKLGIQTMSQYVMGDVFSKDELEQFKVQSKESNSNDFDAMYTIRTNKYSTDKDEYETVLLNKTMVDEYLEEKRQKLMDNDSLLEGVTYQPLFDYYMLDHKDSIGSKGIGRIASKEPITQNYLKERYEKIQDFFRNDYLEFSRKICQENQEIREYNKTVDSSEYKAEKKLEGIVVIDGEEVVIGKEEYNRHYTIRGDRTRNVTTNFYYHEFMNTPDDVKYKNAPEFQEYVEQLSSQGSELWDIYRKVLIAVNIGLVPSGDQKLFENFINEEKASYAMRSVQNGNFKNILLDTISSVENGSWSKINDMANLFTDIFGDNSTENRFQTLLDNYAQTTTNKDNIYNFTFSGDITVDENSSKEYQNFITSNLIGFFETQKKTIDDEGKQKALQSLINNLKNSMDQEVEENSNLLYQYTKNR
jgi:hypothetical protein